MNQTLIFWPMLAHVLLIYIVYGVLGYRRIQAVKGGFKINQFKTRGNEPELSATASANIMNQFELPVIFHIACLAFFVTQGVGAASLTLAWLFVLSRYGHAYVHLTGNRMKFRSPAFRVGFVMVLLLWIWFALQLAGVA